MRTEFRHPTPSSRPIRVVPDGGCQFAPCVTRRLIEKFAEPTRNSSDRGQLDHLTRART
jgi:hypothetical protein